MIVGIGVDVVDVERFAQTCRATPGLVARLFVPGERDLPARSLAARFAAKEALAKALRTRGDLRWHDAVVVTDDDGAPRLEITGSVAARAAEVGAQRVHLSLSHDGGVATAMVVAESAAPPPATQGTRILG